MFYVGTNFHTDIFVYLTHKYYKLFVAIFM